MIETYELFDSKTDKVVFRGTMQQCLDYTTQEPYRKFYIEHKKENHNDRNGVQSSNGYSEEDRQP